MARPKRKQTPSSKRKSQSFPSTQAAKANIHAKAQIVSSGEASRHPMRTRTSAASQTTSKVVPKTKTVVKVVAKRRAKKTVKAQPVERQAMVTQKKGTMKKSTAAIQPKISVPPPKKAGKSVPSVSKKPSRPPARSTSSATTVIKSKIPKTARKPTSFTPPKNHRPNIILTIDPEELTTWSPAKPLASPSVATPKKRRTEAEIETPPMSVLKKKDIIVAKKTPKKRYLNEDQLRMIQQLYEHSP
uniref:Uncharacterized protein n=1 Tax=Paramoeba aestuarina TaxID=180227 RepID=A0A7S4PCF7_9EUKA|mmetsp:Transcript_40108/g.63441  ORF Transcript_40108/g.63441 Transcript_40108/m.63441 type:complete len:244 (+) Transcript_40108:31-762(+)